MTNWGDLIVFKIRFALLNRCCISDPSILPMLFEDFMQSGECWMRTTFMMNLNRSHNQKRMGRHKLLPYHEVKQRFGPAIALQILNEKKKLQAEKHPADSSLFYGAPGCKGPGRYSVKIWSDFFPNDFLIIITLAPLSHNPADLLDCIASPLGY